MKPSAPDGCPRCVDITMTCGRTKNTIPSSCKCDNSNYRTVIYADGTLIINEKDDDITTNRAKHGSEVAVYDPMNTDGTNYVFTTSTARPWIYDTNYIKRVEIGSKIRPTSTAYWFYGFMYCKELDLKKLDTSRVTDMTYMFGYVGNNVTVQKLDLTMFDTRNVTTMDNMFRSCTGVRVIDISSFDTRSVTVFNMMFRYCYYLKTIYASDLFVTTQGDSGNQMFGECPALVGGKGTVYDQFITNKTRARIDNPPSQPGYFTAK